MSLRNGVPLPVRKHREVPEPASADAPLPRRPKRGMGGYALAGVLLALGAGAFAVASRYHAKPSQAPAEEDLSARFVAAPGLVESSGGLRDMAFQMSGQIKQVCVEEGERVKQGQLLAELENEECSARVSGAKAEVGVAEARLKALEGDLEAEWLRAGFEVERLKAEWERLKTGARIEELDRARSEVKAAEIEWKRRANDAKRYEEHPTVSSEQERVMTRGLAEITQAQFEAAQSKLRELEAGTRKEDLAKAEALLKSAEADCARCKGTRDARVAAARQEVEQARAKERMAAAELRKTQLCAPIDGVVVWKFRHPGETVGVLPPERVLTVADVSALRVRADVDEADFAKIRAGQKALVTADAYGGQSFAGRVERVSYAAGEKRFSTGEARERHDVKIVETLITFDQAPPLKLNLRVTVRFDLDAK